MSTPSFVPPGPVGAAFYRCLTLGQAIMGPVGAGKTSVCIMKVPVLAALQRPSLIDGVRRIKIGIIRDTYRNIEKTTLPSWFEWFPKETGRFVGGNNGPSVHELSFNHPKLGRMEITAEFVGLGDSRIEAISRGWEVTHYWLNEADTLSPDVFPHLFTRTGRFPSKRHGKATYRSIYCDFNAPDVDNWTYKTFVENPSPDISFFRQPSGLDPAAENRANLLSDYYEKIAATQPEWFVRRYVRNEWGYSRDGQPVYPEFSDQLHVAPSDLLPIKGRPLILGLDAGLTPACVITQQDGGGQWRVLDEICVLGGTMGANRFADEVLRVLNERYRGWGVGGWADPAAGARASTDERTWVQAVSTKLGMPIRLAPSNKLQVRLEAVRVPMTRLLDGRPGFLLSPRCKVLRKGFNANYRFKRIAVAGSAHYGDEPEKNEYSHVQDALQYALLGGGEYAEVTGRKQRAREAMALAGNVPSDTYDPFNW